MAESAALNELLIARGTAAVRGSARLADLVRRPQLHYDDLAAFDPERPALDDAVREQVEIQLKYAEYNNRGPGSDTSKRVKWSKQLKAKQAAEYSFDKVIGHSDTWDPFVNWQY